MVARELALAVLFAPMHSAPWPHLELDGLLPDESITEVEANWPTTGYQWQRHSDIRKPDGTSLRRYQAVADRFPEIAKALLSSELEEAFRERLGVYSALYPVAHLIEDAPGYKIRPHTDCAGKVITVQLYLADEGADEKQGVMLQEYGAGGSSKQIQYRRNHGYAFKVTDRSWHRVAQCQGRRRSIQLLYYATPNPNI